MSGRGLKVDLVNDQNRSPTMKFWPIPNTTFRHPIVYHSSMKEKNSTDAILKYCSSFSVCLTFHANCLLWKHIVNN